MNDRTGPGSNNANALRKFRDGLFVLFVKQAFGIQFFFELLKGQLQCAHAHGFYFAANNRVTAAGAVDFQLAGYINIQSVFEIKL